MKHKSARVYRREGIESKKVRAAKRRVPLFLIAILVVVSCIFGSPSAHAAVLTLSTHVSNGLDPPDVVDLYATLEFTVEGAELFLAVR